MAIKGVFSSDQHIEGTRVGDFSTMILKTFPTGTSPLLALSSGMPSEMCQDTHIHWFEEAKISGQYTPSAANNSATTINVNDASSLVPMTQILNLNTGEMMFVTAVAANALTVIRGWGGTAAKAVTTSHILQKVGTAFEEGSNRPAAIANVGEAKFNYTQIFRASWDVTGTAKAIKHRTGDIKAKNQSDAIFYHSEEMEKSLIWGRRGMAIHNNQPLHTMNGINAYITTNVSEAGATTDFDKVDDFLLDVFQKNVKGKPNERIAFCGNTTLQVLNNIARKEDSSRIEIGVGGNEYGLDIKKWISPYGTISLQTHPLMVENPTWTKDLYVYHPGCIRTRYLRKTMMEDYDKEGLRAGRDADYGTLTTEMSVEYVAEVTGGKMTGFTAAA